MKKYFPKEIEPKWIKKWAEDEIYETDLSDAKNKYYVLVEWSYPSGDLHMGHWFTFTQGDIQAKFKKMTGYNTFLPNGFDAFGLPAENAAIKRGIHPQDWTMSNIKRMKQQFATMGVSFDWGHEAISCLPEYYKWNQWIFLKMLEKGLAYKGKVLSNWCPNCKTVLANENVEAGRCWRCGAEVIQKEVEQWFLKITAYADRLIWKDGDVDWPKALKEAQNSWIGKSEGVVIKFDGLEVFTTRPDTLYGVTFLVINPEHPLLNELIVPEKRLEVEEYVNKSTKKSELERKENKEKSGVFTGSYVKHPLSGKKIPVWVADYVLPGYGTGAVMGVPAHDERDSEFAKKFDLDIVLVIKPNVILGSEATPESKQKDSGQAGMTKEYPEKVYTGEGVLVNSDDYNGLSSSEAREKISKYIVEHHLGKNAVQYHLHDWSISRQRYWGTPIPLIYCDKCGMVPVPEEDLPVELPYNVDYAPKGKPPLATAEGWVKVKCPKCGASAEREVETMDTFVDSSWYFFRYLDPKNHRKIFNQELVDKWIPVDIYFGGAEHTLGHALYSRFFTKFLHDLNLTRVEEFSNRRVHHGIILGTDGQKMSKSRGNVINPDEQVSSYGADAVRCYLAFLGPVDIVAPWDPNGINGVYHFLERVWGLFDKIYQKEQGHLSPKDLAMMHKTIKKIGSDIENIKYNTAIAALMEWLNHLSRKESVSRDEYKNFILLLSPFAPFITEELWEMLGEKYSVHQQPWPKYEEKYLEEEEITIAIQVNGKLRDQIVISKDILDNSEVVEKMVLERERVLKFLGGKKPMKTIYVPGKVINIVALK